MLVVEDNGQPYWWNDSMPITPIGYAGDIVVTFDPSKTNMAVVIGTPLKDVLKVIEFSGNNRKSGPAMDTTLYCHEVREFLRRYLEGAKLYIAAVEQAILKKGNNYYHSSMVLTEIRANLLAFFLDTYGVKVLEINNWSWKSHVLPQGFRSPFEKGSKKFFQTYYPDSQFSHYFEADVTDCLCIFEYVTDKFCGNYAMYCNRTEQPLAPMSYVFYPLTFKLDSLMKVTFNPTYSLSENVAFYGNRIMKSFYMEVPVEDIDDIDNLYGKSTLFEFNNLNDTMVKVVCARA